MILQKFAKPCVAPLLCNLPSNHLVKSQILKPICTDNSSSSRYSDQAYIVDKIISILSKYPINTHELEGLSLSLTTSIVESVLKGLRKWEKAYFFFSWASNRKGYRHNCYTYNTMAELLSRARQNAPLRALTVDIVQSRCPMSPGALGFLIRCMGNVELAEEANSLFDQVKMMGLCYPNNYSYTCLLEALSNSGSVHLMEMRLNEMYDIGWKPDKYTLTPLIQGYCNAHQFDRALSVFNQILAQGWVDCHVLSILVISFSKCGEVDMAFELFEKMVDRGAQLNEKTCFVLIHGFVTAGRVDKALLVFEKMFSFGFVPDVSIFDVLIGGLCNNGDYEKALTLYSDMNRLGISPDVRILSKLISSTSDERRMIQILFQAKDFKSAHITRLFNTILCNLVGKVSVDHAYDLLRAAIRDGLKDYCAVTADLPAHVPIHLDATSFRVVIDGLSQSNKPDAALSLFKDMTVLGIKPDVQIYNNVINCFSNSDRVDKCNELLREMKGFGLNPTEFTYNCIYGCLCRQENIDGALGLLNEMRVHGHKPWIKHYTLLIKKLCKRGKPNEACDFLDKMVENGFVPDMIAYSAAFDGFLKMRKVDQGLKLFKDIHRRGYCPDLIAYNTIINGLIKARRLSQAHEMVKEMVEKGIVPSVATYNLLIDGWCKQGDVDEAIPCIAKMCEVDRKPNIITYTTIIDGLCTAGRPHTALSYWDDMLEKGNLPNRIAYMALIHGLCKCKKPDTALVYLREMNAMEMKPESFVYVDLLCCFISTSDFSVAVDILEEMIQEGHLPKEADKNYLVVKEAVMKLSEHVTTSSHIQRLIADGCILLDNDLAITS